MNNKNPLVSIVIPVYNGSNYLREAIDSALAQTYKNIEVIVINDGSNDSGKTREIALSYGNRIRYFEKENGGVATALNLGIKEMSGEFFSWLSHDDVYYPGKIGKQIRYYFSLNDESAIVFSDEDIIDAYGNIISRTICENIKQEHFVFKLLSFCFIGGCSILIPKTAFERCGYFNEKLKCSQDYEMWFRMIKVGYKFRYLPMVLDKSRIHPDQDSNRKRNILIDDDNKWRIWVLESFTPEELWGHGENNYNKYMLLSENFKKKGWLSKASFVAKDKALRINNNNFKRYINKIDYYLIFYIPSFFKKIIKFLIRFNFYKRF